MQNTTSVAKSRIEASVRGCTHLDSQHFVFLLVEDHTHLTLSCAIEPLRIANMVSGRTLYSWAFASETGETATASNGTVSLVQTSFGRIGRADRLFVLSGIGMNRRSTPALGAALRRARAQGVKLGALCSGAWILAEAGLLDGMKAAIHWEYHDGFAEKFPEVTLARSVFVADERIVTASGGTATADLMLHLIERDHGHDLSVAVSDMMVYSGAREGTAEQRVSFQSRNAMRNAHMAKAFARMKECLEEPVSPAQIAGELGISVRQLERLFGRYLNTTPKRYYTEMRLERARHLLMQTEMSISEIAIACGFDNPAHFSRTFRSVYGRAPQSQRARLA